jgi:polysaccharide biosynthesis transport protein
MDFFNLVLLYRALLRKIWLLISIPVISIIITFFLTSDIPDYYRSTAQLSTGFTTNDQITITNDGSSIREAGVKFSNLIETMNSELILSLVSYRLIVHDLEDKKPFRYLSSDDDKEILVIDTAKILSIVKSKLGKMELLSSFEPEERMVMDVIARYGYSNWQLIKSISISRVKDTDYLKIQFISEVPRLSAFVVNVLAEEIIRYDNNVKSSRSDQSVIFFENLVAEKKKILDEKNALLNSYKSTNNVIDYSLETNSRLSQISDYELKKNEANSKIQAIKLSIANVDKRLSEINIQQTGNASNERVLQLKSKIDELTKLYVDGGSKDNELLKSITDLRYEYQVEIDRISSQESALGQSKSSQLKDLSEKKNQLQLELEIAQANLVSIENTLRAISNNVSGIAGKEATISVLTSEVESATIYYNQALERFNSEKSKSLLAFSPLRLVIAGQPNGNPERSNRIIIILLSGIASFTICIIVVLGIELLDMRLKNQVQFRKFVPINLIGTINQLDINKLNLDYLFHAQTRKPELDAFKHYLRNIRYELESSSASTFLITSTKQGEGKTFVILCLAYSLSLVKKRILIIDTNFKHNSLTQELLLGNAMNKKLESGADVRGLIGRGSSSSEMGEDDFVTSIISSTNHRGISLIGNSGGDNSPSEIFAGRDFKSMIKKLSGMYDYIFLEGAALNGYSDTKELVDYVDKVIPVFASTSLIKQADMESINFLNSLNGKLMGAVLNGVALRDLKI